MYTSSEGVRRIRIHNSCLTSTANSLEYIKGLDENSIFSIMLKKSINSLFSSSNFQIYSNLLQESFNLLLQINNSNSKRGVIQDSIKDLPKLYLSFLKSELNKNSVKLDVDFSNYLRSIILKSSHDQVILHINPQIYALDTELSEFKDFKRASYEELKASSFYIFIIEVGSSMIIFIKPETNKERPDLLESIFNQSSTDQILSNFYSVSQNELTSISSGWDTILTKVNELRSNNSYYKRLWMTDDYYNPLMNKVYVESNFNKDFSFSLEEFHKKRCFLNN